MSWHKNCNIMLYCTHFISSSRNFTIFRRVPNSSNAWSHTTSFKSVLIVIKIKWRLICKMAVTATVVIFWSCLLSEAGSKCSVHRSRWHIFYKVDNSITFNLIIRFHELKCPCKEIIKATTWGPRHSNLPRRVALCWQGKQAYSKFQVPTETGH